MELMDINLIAHLSNTEELEEFVSVLKGQLTIRHTLYIQKNSWG